MIGIYSIDIFAKLRKNDTQGEIKNRRAALSLIMSVKNNNY